MWKQFQIKAKEITGEDIDIAVADINTDVNVEVNLNDLARTEGIVSLKNKLNISLHLLLGSKPVVNTDS